MRTICLILFANAPVLAQPQATELSNRDRFVAQLTNNQWRRLNLDDRSSIMLPGYSSTTVDGGQCFLLETIYKSLIFKLTAPKQAICCKR